MASPPRASCGGRLAVRLSRVPWLTWTVAIVVLGIAFLVIYPIGTILVDVFFGQGVFAAKNTTDAFADPALGPALANTAILVFGAGGLAVALGAGLAWLNERTDARIGWAADVVPVVPLLIPQVAGAIGWVFLLAPNVGFLNRGLALILGRQADPSASPAIDIYTMGGVVFVTTLFLVPYAYLIMSAALRNLDASLEEASRIFGRGPLGTLFRVTLPSVRPALGTSAALVMMTSVAIFAIPVVIGVRANINVLSVLIFRILYTTFPPRLGEAVVLSSFMLLVVQFGVVGEYLIGRSGHHAVMGGRGHSSTINRLGRWRWGARVLVLIYLAAATVLPFAALLLVSFEKFWTADVVWSQLSLDNYARILFSEGVPRRALLNSLVISAATATVAMTMAALIAFFVKRSPGLLAHIANTVTTLPAALPHIVIAVGFLLTLGTSVFGLGGTLSVLFLAFLVFAMPQATRSAYSALSQVGEQLWESSLMSGASQLRTFVRILLPLMFVGIVAGWVIVFVRTLGESTASVFLSGTENPVVGPVIVDLWQNGGNYTQLAALALIITVMNTVVVLAVLSFARAGFRQAA